MGQTVGQRLDGAFKRWRFPLLRAGQPHRTQPGNVVPNSSRAFFKTLPAQPRIHPRLARGSKSRRLGPLRRTSGSPSGLRLFKQAVFPQISAAGCVRVSSDSWPEMRSAAWPDDKPAFALPSTRPAGGISRMRTAVNGHPGHATQRRIYTAFRRLFCAAISLNLQIPLASANIFTE